MGGTIASGMKEIGAELGINLGGELLAQLIV